MALARWTNIDGSVVGMGSVGTGQVFTPYSEIVVDVHLPQHQAA